ATNKPNTPHVGALRDSSRELAADVQFDVLPRIWALSCLRSSGNRSSVLGRLVKLRTDVCCYLLGAAGVDAPELGIPGWTVGDDKARNLQLLGRQLLGWNGCSPRRRPGNWRAGTN